MASGTVTNSVQDVLAVGSAILESAQKEVVWLVPPSVNSLSRHYDFVEKARDFVQRGGVSRGIVQITHANNEEVLMSVENGEDVRHSDEVHEVFMYVGDHNNRVSAGLTSVLTNTRSIHLSPLFGVKTSPMRSTFSPRLRARDHALLLPRSG